MRYFEYEPDPFDDDDEPRNVECKRCGKAGLHWEDDNGVWVLLTDHDQIHKCDEARVRRAMASEFEPIK